MWINWLTDTPPFITKFISYLGWKNEEWAGGSPAANHKEPSSVPLRVSDHPFPSFHDKRYWWTLLTGLGQLMTAHWYKTSQGWVPASTIGIKWLSNISWFYLYLLTLRGGGTSYSLTLRSDSFFIIMGHIRPLTFIMFPVALVGRNFLIWKRSCILDLWSKYGGDRGILLVPRYVCLMPKDKGGLYFRVVSL